MVTPVGVQQLDFRVGRVTMLIILEIFLNEGDVFQGHCQPLGDAERLQLLFAPLGEPFHDGHFLHLGILGQLQLAHILLAGLHLVDAVFLDMRELLGREVGIENIKLGALDDHFRLGIKQ